MHAIKKQLEGLPVVPPRRWTAETAAEALNRRGPHVKLFGALRLIDAAVRTECALGYGVSPEQESARIDQGFQLGFAGLEVAEVAPAPTADEVEPAAKASLPAHRSGVLGARTPPAGPIRRTRVTQNAVGLLGPNGPMPQAWWQFINGLKGPQRMKIHEGFLAFINILQRRQLSFLYRAWSDSLAITALDRDPRQLESHPISQRLAALGGLAHARLLHRDVLPSAAKLAFTSSLSRTVRNPGSLEAMLRAHFGLHTRMDEFSPRWLEIPVSEQSRLGTDLTKLGIDAVAGERTWDCATQFDIQLGPMDLSRYFNFLPGSKGSAELHDLVSLYAGPEWSWRIRPVLRGDDVPSVTLDGDRSPLGLASWIDHASCNGNRSDLGLFGSAVLSGPGI